jgi:hypothetical protein
MCGFKPLGGATGEKYEGTVEGLVPGAGKQVLVWAVRMPAATKPRAGFLAQPYVKARAPGQAPSWTGETNKAIVLQFESHESSELGSSIERIVLKDGGTSA